MKGDGKLRLVQGGRGAPEPEWDAEPTAEELAEMAAAASADDGLASLLKAAHAPGALGADDLDAIIGRALGDDAAATTLERDAAERLRVELDASEAEITSDTGRLARELRAAVRPTGIDEARNAKLIEQALRAPLRRRLAVVRRIAPATAAAIAAITAIAAGVALFAGRLPSGSPGGAAVATLVHTRSADDLFDAATPFPRTGEESARVDRIAASRTADLRNNRFAAWGVK